MSTMNGGHKTWTGRCEANACQNFRQILLPDSIQSLSERKQAQTPGQNSWWLPNTCPAKQPCGITQGFLAPWQVSNLWETSLCILIAPLAVSEEEALGLRQPGDLSWLQGPPVFRQPSVIPLTLASNLESGDWVPLPAGQRQRKIQQTSW